MDRNLILPLSGALCGLSLSARRAWIEIDFSGTAWVQEFVALRKESVDSNLWWGVRKAVGSLVALRKESVDRNPGKVNVVEPGFESLSARRAWIEIFILPVQKK